MMRDMQDGDKAGVEGTPTVFINGQHYNGSLELEPMRAVIDGGAEKNGQEVGVRMHSTIRPALAVACVCFAALLSSQSTPREQVGPLPGGGFLLNSGWRLDPAGKQVALATLPDVHRPVARRQVPAGAQRRIPAAEHQRHRHRVRRGDRVSVPVADGWLGLAISPKGDRVYVGGGSTAAVFEFALRRWRADGRRALFPSWGSRSRTTRRTSSATWRSRPTGACIYAADLYRDSIVVINPQSGMVIDRYKTGRRPYRILFHPDGKIFFVTHWADGTMGHYDAATGSQLGDGAHRRASDAIWCGATAARRSGAGRADLCRAHLRGRREYQ